MGNESLWKSEGDATKNRLIWRVWSVLGLLLALTATRLQAAEPSQPVVTSRLEKSEAIIEAVDPNTRTVVLKDAHGLYSVVAGAAVHNFEKLHVGDKVKVSYYEGLAARIKKGDSGVSEPVGATYTTPAPGGKPGGEMGHSVTSTVSIEAVDPDSHTVAFKNPDGSLQVVAVEAPNMRKFIRTLKPGDVVEVTYTESVAVDITPAS